jgi:hypothetical protein
MARGRRSTKKFRNDATEGQAAFEALKIGYRTLYVRNEYVHELTDDKLRGLIIKETGEEKDSRVVGLVLSCSRCSARPVTVRVMRLGLVIEKT